MKKYNPIPHEIERLATIAVDAAYKVYRAIGPGLLESVYETCLCHELRLRGLGVETQVDVPIAYEGLQLDSGLRLDILRRKAFDNRIKGSRDHDTCLRSAVIVLSAAHSPETRPPG